MKSNDQLNSKHALNVVREKLLNSLNALDLEAYSGNCILESVKWPLSLNAVAEGPKLLLLWDAFQQVEEEAGLTYFFLPILMTVASCMLFYRI